MLKIIAVLILIFHGTSQACQTCSDSCSWSDESPIEFKCKGVPVITRVAKCEKLNWATSVRTEYTQRRYCKPENYTKGHDACKNDFIKEVCPNCSIAYDTKVVLDKCFEESKVPSAQPGQPRTDTKLRSGSLQ